jgi:hypothetical protein
MKELGPVLDEAIADLRYGCIGINAWIGMGFSAGGDAVGCIPRTSAERYSKRYWSRAQLAVVRQAAEGGCEAAVLSISAESSSW